MATDLTNELDQADENIIQADFANLGQVQPPVEADENPHPFELPADGDERGTPANGPPPSPVAPVLPLAGDLLCEIYEAADAVEEKRRLHEDAKERAKTAKTNYESAQDHLQRVIARVRSTDHSELPLFEQPPRPDADASLVDVQRVDDELDNSWREVPLGDVLAGLGPKVLASFHEANLVTMGDLSAYMEPSATGFAKKLTDLAGIGNAKAEKIEKALEDFWVRWNREAKNHEHSGAKTGAGPGDQAGDQDPGDGGE